MDNLYPSGGISHPFQSCPPLLATPIEFPSYRANSPNFIVLYREGTEMVNEDALVIVEDPHGLLQPSFLSSEVLQGLETSH